MKKERERVKCDVMLHPLPLIILHFTSMVIHPSYISYVYILYIYVHLWEVLVNAIVILSCTKMLMFVYTIELNRENVGERRSKCVKMKTFFHSWIMSDGDESERKKQTLNSKP
jgi:hypothetical protein